MRMPKFIVHDRHSVSAAFTIVEVLMATLIGAVVFAALFAGITQGYNLVAHERESLRASQIVVGRIERIRLCKWGDNSGTNATQLFNPDIVPNAFTDYFYPIGLGGFFPASNVVYVGTITVQATNFPFYDSTGAPVASSPSYCTNMACVTVSVSWDDVRYGRTNTFSRSMKTYVAQYGVQNYISFR